MKFARKLLLLSAACLAGVGQWPASGQPEKPEPPFTLTLSVNPLDPALEDTADKTIRPGSGVTLRIRKTNVSDREIQKRGPYDDRPFGFIFDVRDDKGNPAEQRKPDTPLPMTSGPALIRGTKDMVLQPGESWINYVPLSEWYDLSKPGKYTVQVLQRVSGDPNSAVVKSNQITITVAP